MGTTTTTPTTTTTTTTTTPATTTTTTTTPPTTTTTTPTTITTATTTTPTNISTSSPPENQCAVPEKFYSFSGLPATGLADCFWDFSRCSRLSLSPACCRLRWRSCGGQVVRYQAWSFSSKPRLHLL